MTKGRALRGPFCGRCDSISARQAPVVWGLRCLWALRACGGSTAGSPVVPDLQRLLISANGVLFSRRVPFCGVVQCWSDCHLCLGRDGGGKCERSWPKWHPVAANKAGGWAVSCPSTKGSGNNRRQMRRTDCRTQRDFCRNPAVVATDLAKGPTGGSPRSGGHNQPRPHGWSDGRKRNGRHRDRCSAGSIRHCPRQPRANGAGQSRADRTASGR